MKAITVWQPWATLIAIGCKKIETRSWKTSYRGALAIHAAKHFPKEARDLCVLEPFHSILKEAGYANQIGIIVPARLPTGVVVATCILRSVIEITERNASGLKDPELSFGDFTPGRYAWFLDNIQKLEEPIPARGRQRLWEFNLVVCLR